MINEIGPDISAMAADQPSQRQESLVERALAVTAVALRMHAGEEDRVEAERVLKRVRELDQAIDYLVDAVSVARALSVASGTAVDISSASRGRDQFTRLASGRPPDTVFNRARATVIAGTGIINKAVLDGWAQYTLATLAGLPLHRLAILSAEARDRARAREQSLRNVARRTSITPELVQRFAELAADLAAELDTVADPPAELRHLLERMEKGPIPLSELDDREVALMRQVDDQIEVRRRRS